MPMIGKRDKDSTPGTPTPTAPERTVRIGDLLLEKELISSAQIAQALAHQKEKGNEKLLGEVLVEVGLVTEEQVTEVLAEAYGIPFARINSKLADPRVMDLLPHDLLQKQCIVPLFMVHGKLTIAVHEPTNVFMVEEIARLADCTVQMVAATAKDIRATLEVHLPDSNVFVLDDIVDQVPGDGLTLVEEQVTDLSNLEQMAGDSPVIKLVNYVIFSAVEETASDIHIEAGDKSLRIRYRVDGSLFEKMRPPPQMQPAVVSRIKIMARLDISERRLPQDGGITVMVNKRPVDLRVSIMPAKHGEKVVIRIIDNRDMLTDLSKIGFSYAMLERFRQVLHEPNGVVLVTGPTGSGKSTTLYGMLQELMNDTINICTIEDPIEYNLEGVNQFQVNEKAGFTFASALRALLRQDPDIIMVGEIRDPETALIATQAALTGHLVFATLHTNDAPSAVTRLFNIGVEPYLVAASFRAALAQRLFRKICTNCKEGVEVSTAEHRALDRLATGQARIDTIYRGRGCDRCRSTGYSGRVGVFELFAPDDETLDIISRGATLQEVRRLAAAAGYTTLLEDGLEKVRAGVTTIEELFKNAAIT